jgi:hypothetical protein
MQVPFIVFQSSLQSKSLRVLRPRARVRSNICLEEFPLHGHGRAMILIIIFSVGKTDRSSNKDGSILPTQKMIVSTITFPGPKATAANYAWRIIIVLAHLAIDYAHLSGKVGMDHFDIHFVSS